MNKQNETNNSRKLSVEDVIAHLSKDPALLYAKRELARLPKQQIEEHRKNAIDSGFIQGELVDCSRSRQKQKGAHIEYNQCHDDHMEQVDALGEAIDRPDLGGTLPFFKINFNHKLTFRQVLGPLSDCPKYSEGDEGQKEWERESFGCTRLFDSFILAVLHYLNILDTLGFKDLSAAPKLMLAVWTNGRNHVPVLFDGPTATAAQVKEFLHQEKFGDNLKVTIVACVGSDHLTRVAAEATSMGIRQECVHLINTAAQSGWRKSFALSFQAASEQMRKEYQAVIKAKLHGDDSKKRVEKDEKSAPPVIKEKARSVKRTSAPKVVDAQAVETSSELKPRPTHASLSSDSLNPATNPGGADLMLRRNLADNHRKARVNTKNVRIEGDLV